MHNIRVSSCVNEADEHAAATMFVLLFVQHSHMHADYTHKRSMFSSCSLVSPSRNHFAERAMFVTLWKANLTVRDNSCKSSAALLTNKNTLSKKIWMWQVCKATCWSIIIVIVWGIIFWQILQGLFFFPPEGVRWLTVSTAYCFILTVLNNVPTETKTQNSAATKDNKTDT